MYMSFLPAYAVQSIDTRTHKSQHQVDSGQVPSIKQNDKLATSIYLSVSSFTMFLCKMGTK